MGLPVAAPPARDLKRRLPRVYTGWGKLNEWDWPPAPPANAEQIRARLAEANKFFAGEVETCYDCGKICLRADMHEHEENAGCCAVTFRVCKGCHGWDFKAQTGPCADCGNSQEYSCFPVLGEDGKYYPLCTSCAVQRDGENVR